VIYFFYLKGLLFGNPTAQKERTEVESRESPFTLYPAGRRFCFAWTWSRCFRIAGYTSVDEISRYVLVTTF
jgi:hypothetical protein